MTTAARTQPARRRVLMLSLDGYDPAVGSRLMAAGELPVLRSLAARSARFDLDHTPGAKRSGLAGEHIASGLAPDDAHRWAAVTFDPDDYSVWQEGTGLVPFSASLVARTVVFDPPYFDLERAPQTRGVVAWGAHDPGAPATNRPAELAAEMEARFGPYPATRWTYGFAWPSAEKAREMGRLLTHATDVRAQAARWLLAERMPDWDLALVVTGELHSVLEGLWHGIDETHPLHSLPSGAPARDGVIGVYRAVDRLAGTLIDAFPDATVVAFSMHGMGPNQSDVASMLLLPELLYRHRFGTALAGECDAWRTAPARLPMLAENEEWGQAIRKEFGRGQAAPQRAGAAQPAPPRASAPQSAPPHARATQSPATNGARVARSRLEWMPAAWYGPYWHEMRAFALPSFYDGRVRINLAGRESNGLVDPRDYARACDEVEQLVRECGDVRTGEPVVQSVERTKLTDPRKLDETDADLIVVWRVGANGFDHPRLGRMGPFPFRRTGGHTGGHGMAWFSGADIAAGDYPIRSAFDVVPTVIDLLGETGPARMSGESALAVIRTR